jgi:hypothetical protein
LPTPQCTHCGRICSLDRMYSLGKKKCRTSTRQRQTGRMCSLDTICSLYRICSYIHVRMCTPASCLCVCVSVCVSVCVCVCVCVCVHEQGARGGDGTRVHAQRPLIFFNLFAEGSSGRKWDTCPRSTHKLQWLRTNYWLKISSSNG